jgi:hypothetical protein
MKLCVYTTRKLLYRCNVLILLREANCPGLGFRWSFQPDLLDQITSNVSIPASLASVAPRDGAHLFVVGFDALLEPREAASCFARLPRGVSGSSCRKAVVRRTIELNVPTTR